MPNSVYSSTRGYSSRAARQTGRLDRAAEKSIIDPLRFRVAFYATLYAIPRLRIFGRVRVIRRHTRRFPFLVQAASNRGKEERKVEWIACHRENDASVLHHVQRAIVSLPEKREVYGVKWKEEWNTALCYSEFWNFFWTRTRRKVWIRNNGNKEIDEFWGIKRYKGRELRG